MKSGFVGIIGKANVGKSTLMNALIKEKVSITSKKAQTTRNAIIGVYNDNELQIVFTDTPGVHQAKSTLGTFMNKEALNQVDNVDVIYYLFDVTKRFSDSDQKIIDHIFTTGAKKFLILTKVDLVDKQHLILKLSELNSKANFDEIIPISSVKNDNLDRLINITKKYLSDDIAYFDSITNVSLEFRISEIVREKILNNFHQEIPHMIATLVEDIRYTDAKAFISVLIIVGKETHKSMIIGKQGSSLKTLNYESCKDLKELLDKKIVLNLHVKVDEQWFNNEYKLARYGFNLKLQNE